MTKKKIVIIIILVVALVIGITYAWWDWQSTNNTNVSFNIEGATITYNGGDNITGIKLIPVSSKEKGVNDNTAVYKEITVSSNKTMYLTLNLDLVTFPSTLADKSLVYEIYEDNVKIGNGNFDSKLQGDSITLFTSEEINTTTSTYKLYIWIDGNQDNPETMQNQSFVMHLNASAIEEGSPKNIQPFILNGNAVLDNVNSTYVTGYTTYTISNADKATLKTFIMNDGVDSEGADLCIANEGYFNGCLDSYLEDYNQANDPDIELIEVNTPGIDFTQISSDTNGKGLYIRSGTENDTNPIYYYRGDVDDNNVYFGGFCWKIVRTTDTGGLKMVYNGISSHGNFCDSGNASIGNSAFNINSGDEKYAGYTYDNNGVETDSTIKGVIDTWYQDYLLTDYDSYIEDTVYCNDRSDRTSDSPSISNNMSFIGPRNSINSNVKLLPLINLDNIDEVKAKFMSSPTINTVFGAAYRYDIGIPSLECINNDDKYTKSSSIGNGKLTYPIGLLTMDEIWLAGEDNQELPKNNTYYLYTNIAWWSLSPSFFSSNGVSVFVISDVIGRISVTSINVLVRPVISLKPGLNFTYGNGSGTNPYRFVETIPTK